MTPRLKQRAAKCLRGAFITAEDRLMYRVHLDPATIASLERGMEHIFRHSRLARTRC